MTSMTSAPLFCLLALLAVAPASTLMSAEGDAGKAHVAGMDCCNATCVVCDKPVDQATSVAFKPSDDIKAKHTGIHTAHVGFCSEPCRTAYLSDPAKYEGKVVPQWQAWKDKKVKGT